jgi:adenylate cyclase
MAKSVLLMQTLAPQDKSPAAKPGPAPAAGLPPGAEISPLHTAPLKVERKFLVGELPKFLNLNEGRHVSQGYLAVESSGAEVRILRTGDKGMLCVKTGSGQNQAETELPLTAEQLAALWPLTEGRRMSKVSYTVDIDEIPVSLDMYEGQLSWLRIAEAEFKSFQSADNFSPPPWFHREVTDVHAYRHSNLARE